MAGKLNAAKSAAVLCSGGKMAIRYNSELNNKIVRDVRNYNKRRKLMITKGFHSIPDAVTVSELKSRYTSRKDLLRELKRLKTLSVKNILKKVENAGGVKAVAWKFDYIKQNQQNAIDYYESELKRVTKRSVRFPAESRIVNLIQDKINLLKNDLDYMNQNQFRTAYSAISEFMKSGVNQRAKYRGFLHEVESVMNTLGMPDEVKNKFFNKFKKLSPRQFLYAYDNNDIIARVYSLYFKREDTRVILNTTDDNATDIINSLLEQTDDIIADAQANVD